MMLDPGNDELLPPPSSPTISSISSSDLDTESTGSFFHDRSISLGTLMGVNFPAITFRASSQSESTPSANTMTAAAAAEITLGGDRRERKVKKKTRTVAMAAAADEEERRRWRRRKWWGICWDEEDSRPSSLGEYLEVERRFGDAAFYGGATAELEGMVDAQPRNGRVLFADGRVLPPVETEESSPAEGAHGLCRFSVVSLTGICSSGSSGVR